MNHKRYRKILILFLLFIVFVPQDVFAHAILEKASPAPNSQVKGPPKEIVLTFNERMEGEFYSIKVFNADGDIVTESETQLSIDQKQLSQVLPSLSDGTYTVSYRVLSADGHPIEGSYVFTTGEETSEFEDPGAFKEPIDIDPERSNSDASFSIVSTAIRVFNYIALLLSTGWILWGALRKEEMGEIERSYKRWAIILQISFLITNILMGFIQMSQLQGIWEMTNIASIMTGTNIGIIWTLSMLLSFLGFIFLTRYIWFDTFWAILLLLLKSQNGHAVAFEPAFISISLDFIHLLAASIWSGGLFFILLFWKRHREYVKQFLLIFSRAALVSIIVLIISGAALTIIYLPHLSYLLKTQWGVLLLIKVGLVFMVILTGAFLRSNLKNKKENSIGKWLKIDITMMVFILVIVGSFTHLSPLPQNEPLDWNETKNDIEIKTMISPKIPGSNSFIIDATSLEEGVNIKGIQLFLKYKDNLEVSPIQVPIPIFEQDKSVYEKIEGFYIPFDGNWTIELRILNSNDDESVFSKDFTVY